MSSLRFARSTIAPASGLTRMTGAKAHTPTSASAVAWPVFCHAQIVIANCVIPVPRSDRSWPDQIAVNVPIPFHCSRFMSSPVSPVGAPLR